MLDVHAPHASVHTWRDFLIHIATIVVGLLIAVGLEQTVEAIHHARERRALVDDMRLEAEQNVAILHTNIDVLAANVIWVQEAMKVIRQAQPQDGSLTVTLPSNGTVSRMVVPNRSVWVLAQTNGQAALLPDWQAKIYGRQDRNAVLENDASLRRAITGVALQEEEMRLGIRLSPGATITLPLTERAELLRKMAEREAAARTEAERKAYSAGAADAIVHNVTDRKAMEPYLFQESDAVRARLHIDPHMD